MKRNFSILLVVFLSVAGVLTTFASTLDNAPFQIVLPSNDWKLNDSSAQNMGKDVFLVASITSTKTQSKSVVIKADSKESPASELEGLCAGIRDSFSNPAVKKLSDEETSFLGYKARHFTYEVNGNTYNEAIVFVSGKAGWTIACTGLLEQKSEIQKLLTFYQKKNQ
ncbi:MAG TPA: hypothetical protein VF492_12440 [Verrucomicrobiae bacterium]